MSSKSWLAVDAGTAPMLRAQELRFAWERFVDGLGHGGDADDGDPDDVREPIVDSWRRSYAAGIDPTGNQMAPVVADEDETQVRWRGAPARHRAPRSSTSAWRRSPTRPTTSSSSPTPTASCSASRAACACAAAPPTT